MEDGILRLIYHHDADGDISPFQVYRRKLQRRRLKTNLSGYRNLDQKQLLLSQICLNLRKKLSDIRCVQPWNRLPMKVRAPSFLKVFKKRLDTVSQINWFSTTLYNDQMILVISSNATIL